jgi:hypothetical protein
MLFTAISNALPAMIPSILAIFANFVEVLTDLCAGIS